VGSMNDKKCAHCGKFLAAEKQQNKFCNQSCAAKHNNRLYPKRGDGKERNCLQCGTRLSGRLKQKYCSHKCQWIFSTLKAIIDSENGDRVTRAVAYRKYLISIHGAKCMKCGWSEKNPITNTVPIEMNHIDGNSTNTKLNNLELLCPNCHSLTPTHRGLNRGNGRFLRTQRYREGKSY